MDEFQRQLVSTALWARVTLLT